MSYKLQSKIDYTVGPGMFAAWNIRFMKAHAWICFWALLEDALKSNFLASDPPS